MNSRLFGLIALIVQLGILVPAFAQVEKLRGGTVPAQDFYKRYALNSADPANIEMVPDPAGSGRTVLMARVRNTDEKVFGGYRTEISPLKEYQREGIRWYAMSVYFPDNWEFNPAPTVVSQIHTSQKSTVLSPPISFVAIGDALNLELNSNTRKIEGEDPATKENSSKNGFRLDKIKTKQWYCFVIRADWSHTPGSGALTIWMNGDKVYESLKSPNAYETWLGNWPKSGLYMPGGKMAVAERTIYTDFIHMGGPKSSYAEMAALTPCTQ